MYELELKIIQGCRLMNHDIPNLSLQVGHGETVTVRVPTHSEGNALFWEFATDSYDVAFGLFFEWTDTDEKEISVHVSDSEDEDLDEYEGNIHTIYTFEQT